MAETPIEGQGPELQDTNLPPPKPYHAKRPHKKSRSGCHNCKARKVKCDESRPVCRSCKLRKTDCVYPEKPRHSSAAASASRRSSSNTPRTPSSIESASSPINAAGISSASSVLLSEPILALAERTNGRIATIPSELLYCPIEIDQADMKALWFYATQTSGSFSTTLADDGHKYIMRSLLVRYGAESPFLLDTIFALSGLHMQRLNQQVDPKRFLTYRVKSFAGYRHAIEAANPADFPAMLANSLLLTALSSENFREPEGTHLYILDWLVVWKGISLVMELVSQSTVFESGLNSLFFRPPADLQKAATFIPSQLLRLVSSIKPSDADYPFREAYIDTLKYLGSLYMDLAQGPSSMMSLRIITIFTFLPTQFIDIARTSQPRALVILAYFATFFKLVEWQVWWLDGVGGRTIRDICNHLGMEWQEYLQVPYAALDAHGHKQLSQIILEGTELTSPQNYLLEYEAPVDQIQDLF